MDFELANWLKDGEYRIRVLKMLGESNLLPSEIARKLGINKASVSRILKDLKGRGLIECVSKGSRTKTYFLTEHGKKSLGGLKNE